MTPKQFIKFALDNAIKDFSETGLPKPDEYIEAVAKFDGIEKELIDALRIRGYVILRPATLAELQQIEDAVNFPGK